MMLASNRTTLTRATVARALTARNMTILSKESAEDYKKLNYTARMKASGRPVSPHVTIYAFPVTALSSITNRVTGCLLSVGCAGLGALELGAGSGSSLALMQTIGAQGFLVATSAKLAVSFPIIYHYLGALRHLAWDNNPDMLTNDDAAASSVKLFGGATVLSLLVSLGL